MSCQHASKCTACGRCTNCDSHKPCMVFGERIDRRAHTLPDDGGDRVKRILARAKKCPYCTGGKWDNPKSGKRETCKNCRGSQVVK